MTISMTLRRAINSMANGLGIGGMAVVARRIGAPSLDLQRVGDSAGSRL